MRFTHLLHPFPKTAPPLPRRRSLCYTDSWMKGFTVFTAYKAGTYCPGMEKTLTVQEIDTNDSQGIVKTLLAGYNRVILADARQAGSQKTFREVYKEFYDYKYVQDQSRTYAKGTIKNTHSAYKNWGPLHGRVFSELRHDDLQKALDACPLKHSSHENMLNLIHLMYDYVQFYEYVDEDYSARLKINIPDDDEHGVPFSDGELQVMWEHADTPCIEMILIMCYSGFRVSACKTMTVNLQDAYFQGGVKTTKAKIGSFPSILPSCLWLRGAWGVMGSLWEATRHSASTWPAGWLGSALSTTRPMTAGIPFQNSVRTSRYAKMTVSECSVTPSGISQMPSMETGIWKI